MGKRVILVDDSKTILATAQMALEEMIGKGMIEFATYLNPAELLDALLSGAENYDLLISDINMAQMSGLDLSEQLKAHDKFKNKPILILTTESSPEMKARGKAIGVTGWMVKPFSDDKLIKAITMESNVARNSLPSTGFAKTALAPRARTVACVDFWRSAETITMIASGLMSRIILSVSIPSITGIVISKKTISGACSL